jgi:hypothetical protein
MQSGVSLKNGLTSPTNPGQEDFPSYLKLKGEKDSFLLWGARNITVEY